MNLRDLRYLVSLAEHRHFGRAAEASFVSQPTLSTQIRKLEEELGVALVERTPRKVLLTEVGREIAQRAREVLNEVEQIRAIARRLPKTRLLVIPKCGHSPHRDQPELLADNAARFILDPSHSS